MTRVRVVVIAGLGALLLALPQSAQAQGSAGDISGGYRLIHGADQTFSLGWYADVLGNITDSFGVVGDVAGHYKSVDETENVGGVQVNVSGNLRIHTFMGGARLSWRRNPRITPFVQALVGLAHGSAEFEGSATVGGRTFTVDESETFSEFAADLGGGVNIRATDSMSVRVAGSWFRVVEEDAENAFRFSLGVVFPF